MNTGGEAEAAYSAQAARPFLARLGWPLRLGVLVLVLGYAALCALSGADRMTAATPEAIGVLGWPYDSMTARRRADDALNANQPGQAAILAARALQSDPVDPTVVGQLGWARMHAGDAAGAAAAFQVSGTMGWRDQYTQLYWMDRGLQLGEAGLAAQRLDALLRQAPQVIVRDKLFDSMAATPEGRAALAQRLAGNPNWGSGFLSAPRDLPAQNLANRVDVVRHVPAAALDCSTMGALSTALVAVQMVGEAEEVWRKACGAGPELIYDGRFSRFSLGMQGGARAFDWQVLNRGDVSLMLNSLDANSRELEIRVAGAIGLPVLRQVIVLPSGPYRLTWSMPGLSPSQAAMVKVGLGCSLDRGSAFAGQPLQGQAGRYVRDIVLDNTCHARALIFWIEPGVDVRLSDIQLAKTGS